MSTKWGGSIKRRPDGDYHCTLWKANPDGGKGQRVSWNQGSPVTDLHWTDQDKHKHSSDPKDWRTYNGEDVLGSGCIILFALAAGAITTLSLAAATIIHLA